MGRGLSAPLSEAGALERLLRAQAQPGGSTKQLESRWLVLPTSAWSRCPLPNGDGVTLQAWPRAPSSKGVKA